MIAIVVRLSWIARTLALAPLACGHAESAGGGVTPQGVAAYVRAAPRAGPQPPQCGDVRVELEPLVYESLPLRMTHDGPVFRAGPTYLGADDRELWVARPREGFVARKIPEQTTLERVYVSPERFPHPGPGRPIVVADAVYWPDRGLWRHDRETGETQRVLEGFFTGIALHHDRLLVAGDAELVVVPLDGGAPRAVARLPEAAAHVRRWSSDPVVAQDRVFWNVLERRAFFSGHRYRPRSRVYAVDHDGTGASTELSTRGTRVETLVPHRDGVFVVDAHRRASAIRDLGERGLATVARFAGAVATLGYPDSHAVVLGPDVYLPYCEVVDRSRPWWRQRGACDWLLRFTPETGAVCRLATEGRPQDAIVRGGEVIAALGTSELVVASLRFVPVE
jgi:hypothetical protein